MVRLKVYAPTTLQEWLVNFNSTMVRLKVSSIFKGVSENVFQFHYGTIKRAFQIAYKQKFNTFQFHYGTIKRNCLLRKKNREKNFNSTMVRLKD